MDNGSLTVKRLVMGGGGVLAIDRIEFWWKIPLCGSSYLEPEKPLKEFWFCPQNFNS
jgi:hypothetical protein